MVAMSLALPFGVDWNCAGTLAFEIDDENICVMEGRWGVTSTVDVVSVAVVTVGIVAFIFVVFWFVITLAISPLTVLLAC